jgi:hypothetical protein
VHTTVHASCAEATRFACEAGVDMIEHAAMWTISDAGPLHEFDVDLVDDIVQRGIYVGPTLQASYCEILDLNIRKEQRALTFLEKERLDYKRQLFDNTRNMGFCWFLVQMLDGSIIIFLVVLILI